MNVFRTVGRTAKEALGGEADPVWGRWSAPERTGVSPPPTTPPCVRCDPLRSNQLFSVIQVSDLGRNSATTRSLHHGRVLRRADHGAGREDRLEPLFEPAKLRVRPVRYTSLLVRACIEDASAGCSTGA